MKKKLALISLLTLSLNAYTSEVDSYHERFSNLKDSTESINQFSNILFDKVLDSENNKSIGCNDLSLYKSIRKEFHNHMHGHFNTYISDSKDIERISLKTVNSIYGKFTIRDSIILGLVSKYISDTLASAINVNGHFVGTDKFEHFAGTGFSYFKNFYLEHKSIESTLAIGEKAENGILGAYSTGVKSYGDMVAEFNGMRFWNHLLNKNNDILGINLGPYVSCQNGQWKKVKSIDFSQYVDDSWDEGINCSKFRTQKMLDEVENNIKNIKQDDGTKLGCPMRPKSLIELSNKYGQYSKIILNNKWDISK